MMPPKLPLVTLLSPVVNVGINLFEPELNRILNALCRNTNTTR